ncbi:AMP-binding protein [bacterium]|nr:AMP-binding protein [bacterium]
MIDPRQNVPQQFARVVCDHAHQVAIAGGDWEPTYQELDDYSHHLAHHILQRLDDDLDRSADESPAIQDRIALLMSHDAPLLAAMLAVLKAGRVVVVLHPHDPPDRWKAILTDAQPAMIVTDEAHASLAKQIAEQQIAVLVFPSTIGSIAPNLPTVNTQWNDVACLIHTSGSTGRPKGVMRTHGQILDCIKRFGTLSAEGVQDRVIALASCSTGQGQTTAWTTLLRGATLCPFFAADRGVTGLVDFMITQRITVYISSVSLFRCLTSTMGDERLDDIRMVRLASEPPTMADFHSFKRHFANDCRLTNALSSSETGVVAHWRYDPSDPASSMGFQPNDRDDRPRLPIGEPVEGIEFHLVDDDNNEVADGEPGQVVVQSPFFAAGYWRDPALTARHFSFDSHTGNTTFRSGDLLKREPNGGLFFAGRRDARLKIRGYRIEPADVERAIQSQAGIESAIVGPMKGPAAEPLLVAYFKAVPEFTDDLHSLRNNLRDRLPDYMIPARFIRVDAFPLTASGKIDRHELFSRSLPDSNVVPVDEEPQTETEHHLAAIWKKVFQRVHVRRHDHFFELGGDSLMAAMVAAHVHADSAIEVPLRLFNNHPILCDLAVAIDRAKENSPRKDPRLPMAKVSRDQPLPLSFAQEWIWQESMIHTQAENWTTIQRHRLTGPLNVELFGECLEQMFARHEILRTTYSREGARPMATVHPYIEPAWSAIDLSHEADPCEAASGIVLGQIRNAPFELHRLPLVRFWIVRVREDEHLLFRATHHIIVDAWSWKVFFNELTQLYQSRLEGKSSPLADAPQYVDYAAQQRAMMETDSRPYERSIDWWQKKFRGHPGPLRLPFARRKPRLTASVQEGVREFPIAPETSQRLDRIAVQADATHFTIRFAVLAAALAEAAGTREIVLGAYSTGRTRLEWQNMFGMFANLMTLRLRWNPQETFISWLRSVTETIADAREHAEIPYQLLCQELKQRRRSWPAIHAIITTTDLFAPSDVGGLKVSPPERLVETMPWGLSLSVVQHVGDLWRCEFDARRFDLAELQTFLARCEQLFDLLSLRPDQPLAEVMKPRHRQNPAPFRKWFDRHASQGISDFAHSTAHRLRQYLQESLRIL